MKLSHASILAAASLVAAKPKPYPKPLVSSKAIQDAITTDGLMGNLQALQDIATANGGNRAFGLPGYAASVDYILSQAGSLKGFKTWVQDFPALFTLVESIGFVVGSENITVIGLSYSPSTPEDGITAALVAGPTGDVGCTAEGYAGLDVTDKIVIVPRGTCPDGTTLAGRMKPAAAAGAAAVVIYNNVATPATAGTLSAPNPEEYVSTGFINQDVGLALVERLNAGETIEATFQQTQLIEERVTQNVFTETEGGDASNVVMLGAHLDSVQAGPGINDDGSGTSLILEVAKALQNFDTTLKVRFGWWGAEENGLLGSEHYVNNLAPAEVDSILAYLNFDMVSRGYFGVFDGDGSSFNLSGPAGSDVIEKIFYDDMTAKGINVTAARFTGGSDYASFMDILGKPVGGLHTGTGVEQDPCYHQVCDTIDNPNPETLTINAKVCLLLRRDQMCTNQLSRLLRMCFQYWLLME